MNETDRRAFAALFRQACQKCFSFELTKPLSESECYHLSSEILEKTGLVIGWKSLKNYSHFVLRQTEGKPREKSRGKAENPSVATLDTLVRYVAGAPATTEVLRKKREGHYPYWFRYKEAFYRENQTAGEQGVVTPGKRARVKWPILTGLALVMLLCLLLFLRRQTPAAFVENFNGVAEDSLANRGWLVKSLNAEYWARRAVKPGHLTLFTLTGDNWPDSAKTPGIQNLLLRKIPFDCLIAEVHFRDFFPQQNWQQAGFLLLEDSTFTGKSVRLSIGYNDFAGGFPGAREVIIQAITSLGRDLPNPEEIAHRQIFTITPGSESLVRDNLQHSALRIEKRGVTVRLLYSCSPVANFAFKEVVAFELDFQPEFIGLFALKGFVEETEEMAVYVDLFSLVSKPCSL